MFDGLSQGRPAFLASVTSAAEALLALQGQADLIDAKDPSRGALGALDAAVVRGIVSATSKRAVVSATVGDLPAEASVLVPAVMATAAIGVDIVKVGFFGDGDATAAIAALGNIELGDARLVAVLMADREPDFGLIAGLADAGFAGVMLDTANKDGRTLVDVLDDKTLAAFIKHARRVGLATGLAGSLRLQDIPALAALKPDVLGFRGALCDTQRTGALNLARVQAVRSAIDAVRHDASRQLQSVA